MLRACVGGVASKEEMLGLCAANTSPRGVLPAVHWWAPLKSGPKKTEALCRDCVLQAPHALFHGGDDKFMLLLLLSNVHSTPMHMLFFPSSPFVAAGCTWRPVESSCSSTWLPLKARGAAACTHTMEEHNCSHCMCVSLHVLCFLMHGCCMCACYKHAWTLTYSRCHVYPLVSMRPCQYTYIYDGTCPWFLSTLHHGVPLSYSLLPLVPCAIAVALLCVRMHMWKTGVFNVFLHMCLVYASVSHVNPSFLLQYSYVFASSARNASSSSSSDALSLSSSPSSSPSSASFCSACSFPLAAAACTALCVGEDPPSCPSCCVVCPLLSRALAAILAAPRASNASTRR